jgi:hypothetical protein
VVVVARRATTWVFIHRWLNVTICEEIWSGSPGGPLKYNLQETRLIRNLVGILLETASWSDPGFRCGDEISQSKPSPHKRYWTPYRLSLSRNWKGVTTLTPTFSCPFGGYTMLACSTWLIFIRLLIIHIWWPKLHRLLSEFPLPPLRRSFSTSRELTRNILHWDGVSNLHIMPYIMIWLPNNVSSFLLSLHSERLCVPRSWALTWYCTIFDAALSSTSFRRGLDWFSCKPCSEPTVTTGMLKLSHPWTLGHMVRKFFKIVPPSLYG